MDLGRAAKAPFEDPEWLLKLGAGIGSGWLLLSLIGLLRSLPVLFFVMAMPLLCGTQVEYIFNVGTGGEVLPSLGSFGKKCVDGFMVGFAVFVYALPITILFAIMLLPALLAAVSSGDTSNVAEALVGSGCLFLLIAPATALYFPCSSQQLSQTTQWIAALVRCSPSARSCAS